MLLFPLCLWMCLAYLFALHRFVLSADYWFNPLHPEGTAPATDKGSPPWWRRNQQPTWCHLEQIMRFFTLKQSGLSLLVHIMLTSPFASVATLRWCHSSFRALQSQACKEAADMKFSAPLHPQPHSHPLYAIAIASGAEAWYAAGRIGHKEWKDHLHST